MSKTLPPPQQCNTLSMLHILLFYFHLDLLGAYRNGTRPRGSNPHETFLHGAYRHAHSACFLVHGFEERLLRPSRHKRMRLRSHSFQDGHRFEESSLSSSTDGWRSHSCLREERITIPIVIMDAILPNQTLHFSSQDPKFDALIQYVLSTTAKATRGTTASAHNSEIGILGVDPPTKLPLTVGVTAPIVKKDVIFGINAAGQRVLATSLKGKRRFKIIEGEEPWMDPTNSFYMAQVQILDDFRPEESSKLSMEQEQQVHHLHQQIPALIDEWVQSLIKTEKLSPAGVTKVIQQSGTTMPDTPRQRAFWVAALLNPTIPLGLCQEIRPAMLSCKNDHDRLLLASVALRTSIDLLWKDNGR